MGCLIPFIVFGSASLTALAQNDAQNTKAPPTDISSNNAEVTGSKPPADNSANNTEASGSESPANNSDNNAESAGSLSQSAESTATPQSDADHKRISKLIDQSLLEGKISVAGKASPLLYGKIETVPKGTKVDLTLMHDMNSEINQKGDEIWMRIAHDVKDAATVAIPGGWFAHGIVMDAAGQKRLGRDGFIEVEFDKLVSPDGETEVPFKATVSTKDSLIKSTAKEIFTDSEYTTVGAVGGAILSLQLTGIPGAIATHGLSVAVGAGIGGGIGLFGSLKRKGSVASLYPGDDLKLTIGEPLVLPGFNPAYLASAKPRPALTGMKISVNKYAFYKDPSGDKRSSLLAVDMTINNHTKSLFSFKQVVVVSDYGKIFTQVIGSDWRALQHKVNPNSSGRMSVIYEVDGKKHKYWLSLLDRGSGTELSRVPIN